jgi:hypothetical protein
MVQSQSGCFLEEKNILSVPGFEMQIVQFVACVLSTLSQLNDWKCCSEAAKTIVILPVSVSKQL